MLRYISFTLIFLRVLNHEETLNFTKYFFCICRDGHIPSVIVLLMHCITFIDLYMQTPGMNTPWSYWITFLKCFWIQFATVLLRIFASKLIKILVFTCLVCEHFYLLLVLGKCWHREFRRIPSSCVF